MPARYLLTSAVAVAAGIPAGIFYSNQEGIPAEMRVAVIAALLAELLLYLMVGWPDRLVQVPAPVWAATGVLPYLLYSVPTGVFRWEVLVVMLLAVWLVLAWYQWLPHRPPADLLFLALMAAPLLLKLFPHVFVRPHVEAKLEVMGQLVWVRMGVYAALRYRRAEGIGLGLWPKAAEWKTGLKWFALFLPVAAVLAPLTGFARYTPPDSPQKALLVGVGTFFGILWVVALSEEFFFRGLLQQWAEQWTGNRWAGLVLASAVFGCAHLGFREFPNWAFALVAGTAGLFYGTAFREGRSIRAAMVTHACVVTVWRVFFR